MMSHQLGVRYTLNWHRGTSHLGNTKSEVKSKFGQSSENNSRYFLSFDPGDLRNVLIK